MKTAQVILLTLSLQSISACAVYYTPTPSRPFEPIPEFSSTNSITLQNGQASTEQVAVLRNLFGNLNAWTDVAMLITKRELTKRGMRVDNDADRILRMSIVSARTEVGWVDVTTRIAMDVKTSDGYSATFTGLNSSKVAANTERQIDGALMRVVVQMLKDPRIVSFLTR